MGRRDTGWLKLYYGVIDDPKIMGLSADERWLWVELLCIAGEHDQDGLLPELSAISFRLHRSLSVPERLQDGVGTLLERNLIDKVSGGQSGFRLKVHDWTDWQPKSKGSTERVKRFRERSSNADETRSSRAPAKTDYRLRPTDRQTAGGRPREDDLSTSSPSKTEKEIDAAEPSPQAKNAQHEHAQHLVDRMIANYEKSLEKGVNRAKVEAIWKMLSAKDQQATAEGFIVWLLEVRSTSEPIDPKFVKGLDKLLEERTLQQRKIADPGPDARGRPANSVPRAILGRWLEGEVYGAAGI